MQAKAANVSAGSEGMAFGCSGRGASYGTRETACEERIPTNRRELLRRAKIRGADRDRMRAVAPVDCSRFFEVSPTSMLLCTIFDLHSS